MLTERIGIIDLGTNSIRFDIHAMGPGGRTRLLHREKLMVRLGDAVFLRGSLGPGATHRTLEALQRFKRIADELETERIIAFGTSTLREASDSDGFLRRVHKSTGIRLKIISGEEEARLIAAGILSKKPGLIGDYALIDIGGGSTEISICRNHRILFSQSFPLGVARLQQLFLKTIPPRGVNGKGLPSMEELRRYIRGMLVSYFLTNGWPKVDRVIGSSGTIKALARISKRQTGKKGIQVSFLKELVKEMGTRTEHELTNIPGMDPKRVDLILAGALLLEESMDALGAKRISFTNYALRDGILRQEVRKHGKEVLKNPFAWGPWYSLAKKHGGEEAKLRQLVDETESFFSRCARLHQLDTSWLRYLVGAVILRDIGWFISPLNHSAHSAYIIRYANLPAIATWEREFIAQLCLRHEGTEAEITPFPFKSEGWKQREEPYKKLLALLRLIDALDPAFQKIVTIKRLKITRNEILLTLAHGPSAELAQLRMQEKRALFEELFKRELKVEVMRGL